MDVKKQTKVKPDQEGRADRVVQELTELSRADVRGLFDHQCVRINGKVTSRAGDPVKAGDVVEVRYDMHRRYHERLQPRSRSFKLVYEDEHLLVVEKAAGVLSVPTTKHEQNTLVHELARYVSKGPRIRRRISIVHRLDRETSGLLVFGKSHTVAERLKMQFSQRKPEREYIAIVYGRLEQDEGTIKSHLATARDLDQYSTPDPEKGKLAITHYTVQKRLKNATVVKVQLETGRRNQIRVHFAEQGHPILGDSRYRPDLALQPEWDKKRLALHATVLGFRHPVTNKPLRFVSQLPSAFGRYMKGK
jgi:23S rRNA pseudouridine1911/1915/1917 synthase